MEGYNLKATDLSEFPGGEKTILLEDANPNKNYTIMFLNANG